MERGDVVREPERLEQRVAAVTEHHLLREAVARVAAVERSHERTIFGRVAFEIGIEQIGRDDLSRHADDVVNPRADFDVPAFDLNDDGCGRALQALLGMPRVGELVLAAVRVDLLHEVAVTMHHGDRDERHAEIGRRAQHIACEHAQASAVRGQCGLECDLHREVGDACGRRRLFRGRSLVLEQHRYNVRPNSCRSLRPNGLEFEAPHCGMECARVGAAR